MNRAIFYCLMLALIVTIITPVTEIFSSTLYSIMYWTSIILYFVSLVIIVLEEKKYGWPYKD